MTCRSRCHNTDENCVMHSEATISTNLPIDRGLVPAELTSICVPALLFLLLTWEPVLQAYVLNIADVWFVGRRLVRPGAS